MVLDFQTLKFKLRASSFIQDGLVVDVLDSRTHVFRSSWHRPAEILVFLTDQAEAVEKWRWDSSHGCARSRAAEV